MKTKVEIVGSVNGQEFIAEVNNENQCIVCYAKHGNEALRNNDTEERANYIWKQMLKEHGTLVLLGKWTYFEVQTFQKDITVAKITGLKMLGEGLTAEYGIPTSEELKQIEPVLLKLAARNNNSNEK